MYVATVDCATLNPSVSSSPWIRGAPQSWLSVLICRISARSSISICGRPHRERDFQRQQQRKPARCQRTSVSGSIIVTTFRIEGNQRYISTKNPQSLFVRWALPRTFRRKNDQLMSKYRILSLKPAFRLEWRGQRGQNEADQRYHCANLADSVT